ncbi:MAG: CoA pyrophosphatase [Desulfobacterales bacterium]|nr:MAG: CoA pyrophosphatase [Desulfobacterales bacterium]
MSFNRKIIHALDERYHQDYLFSKKDIYSPDTSAVLFLLGPKPNAKESLSEPCLLLTKRSARVKQPGDLCCPGGSISSRFDTFLAKLLYLPGTPLTQWPCWPDWHKKRPREMRNLALFFATSLRESFEEIGLNPFGLKFLGPLPSQRLVMFKRVIYPLVCWVSYQKRFYLNWEVNKIVFIPLKKLLNPSNYARYRVKVNPSDKTAKHLSSNDYPCFIHKEQDDSEVLWGATFRIVVDFLDIAFGFKFPDTESLPVIFGTLGENYLTGGI